MSPVTTTLRLELADSVRTHEHSIANIVMCTDVLSCIREIVDQMGGEEAIYDPAQLREQRVDLGEANAVVQQELRNPHHSVNPPVFTRSSNIHGTMRTSPRIRLHHTCTPPRSQGLLA